MLKVSELEDYTDAYWGAYMNHLLHMWGIWGSLRWGNDVSRKFHGEERMDDDKDLLRECVIGMTLRISLENCLVS